MAEKGNDKTTRGGTREQHAEAGRQSRKSDGNGSSAEVQGSKGGSTRGGSREQHAEAGKQSHKDNRDHDPGDEADMKASNR